MLLEFLSTVKDAISSTLVGWQIEANEIPAFPSDKLVILSFLDFTAHYRELGNYAYSGNIAVVLYKEFGTPYQEQIEALESVVNLIDTLDIEGVVFGDNSPTVATVGSPQMIVDATGKRIYREIMIRIPFEIGEE